VDVEYHNKTLTRVFGSPRAGCYFLAFCIFSCGLFRDHLCVFPLTFPSTIAHILGRYQSALQNQPRQALLPAPLATLVPAALFAAGQTLVLSSTWALGVTGTFLGDYFGILMAARVEGFPFNVLRDPMYVGSTLCFAATALWCVCPLSGWKGRRADLSDQGMSARRGSSLRRMCTSCTSSRCALRGACLVPEPLARTLIVLHQAVHRHDLLERGRQG
jgi:hypothetical protein